MDQRKSSAVSITPNPEYYVESIKQECYTTTRRSCSTSSMNEYYATTSDMNEYYVTTSGMADYYAAATADELCTSRAVFEFSDYEADCYLYMDGIMMDSAAERNGQAQ